MTKKLVTNSIWLIAMLSSVSALNAQSDTKVITDFKDKGSALTWKIVNDGVMGGLSKGSSHISEASNLFFKGDISLKNNGGFSSTRSFGKTFDLEGYKGVEIRVKGDGRMYYFTARANRRSMLAFWSPVQTKEDEWINVKIPFEDFYATSFGRKIPNLKLDLKNITSFGLMLYDKKDGRFSLELDSIKAYK